VLVKSIKAPDPDAPSSLWLFGSSGRAFLYAIVAYALLGGLLHALSQNCRYVLENAGIASRGLDCSPSSC
jgi:hypothetical protein